MAVRIEAQLAAFPTIIELAGHFLDARSLTRVYAPRDYQPLWVLDSHPRVEVSELLATLKDAPSHGLDPASYPIGAIEERLSDASPDSRAELDLLSSAALADYVSDLRAGRSDPTLVGETLLPAPPRDDASTILDEALGGRGLDALIQAAEPPHSEYGRLRRAMAKYRRLAAGGDWPTLADGPTLERGSTGPAVRQLCRRLAHSGEYTGRCDLEVRFDAELETAVRRFQGRHALAPDGRVGSLTRAQLNRPPAHWARRIALNLERWRWLPRDLGERFVFVNVPSFELRLVEQGRTTRRARVIVGTPEHPTPPMLSRITGLVINPPWRVPASIAGEKLLPQILADPDFLARNAYEVLPKDGAPEPIPAHRVDWEALDPERMELRLRQLPGPQNALGRIRFDVSNDRAIYLHDTPAQHLFREPRRAFSWGCVRVEAARELAEVLLADDPLWSRERLDAEIESRETRAVDFGEAVPLYLTYLTVRAAEDDGELEFFDDVYGRDARLEAVLDGTLDASERPRSRRDSCEDPPADSAR